MRSHLTFGAFSTAAPDNLGRYYKTQPINFPSPERMVNTYEVPGRNGALVVDHNSYKNVDITAEIVIPRRNGTADFLERFDNLRTSLLTQRGYQRLEDSLYPDEYRMACIKDVTYAKGNPYSGVATVTFDAMPQRYLTSGETAALTLSSDQVQSVVIGIGSDIFNDEAKAELSEAMLAQRWIVIKAYEMPPGAFRFTARYGLDVYHTQVIYGDGLLPGQTLTEIESDTDETTAHTSYRQLGIVGGATGDHCVYAVNADECIWWQVADREGNVLGVSDHVVGQMTPPDEVLEYTPLLHIHRPQLAEITQDDIIGVNNTGSISFYQLPPQLDLGTYSIPIGDLYIDCATFNSYAVNEGETYSINPYVTMTGSFLVPGHKPGYYRLGSEGLTYPITLEVIPRWWRV